MKQVVFVVAVTFAILASVTLSGFACAGGSKPMVLPSVEIEQYEGIDLSSINDFRENSIKGPQYIDIGSYELKITGLVENPLSFRYDDVFSSYEHYEKVVTLNCVEGWSVTILWEGVMVKDLIEQAKSLPNAKVVIFHAYDGYTTSFPIDYIISNDILMAYKMNDVVIPPERGFPFQLVAESKWGYKWIKWITEIELSDDVNYRGYWESRGYSNEGDLNKGFFGR
ncbi:MAG: oxidoreductase [Chloroflexi bacterium RBG_13_54_9]|nr:MAG: oxidoreductase [Chloroflexi bacterium RBG_13_54_9]